MSREIKVSTAVMQRVLAVQNINGLKGPDLAHAMMFARLPIAPHPPAVRMKTKPSSAERRAAKIRAGKLAVLADGRLMGNPIVRREDVLLGA